LEFKLTTLAGFVLVPFALWGKTAFLAERVLGNVVSSGIKVMVLAVIVGIGSTFFSQFTSALGNQPTTLSDAMSLVLASLSLFGLGIFGPGIAAGLVSGAPQLGAGAAVGTAAAMAGSAMLAGGGLRAAGGAGLSAVRAGAALGAGASTAYGLARAASPATGAAGVAAGLGGVARAAAGAAGGGIRDSVRQSATAGREAAWRSTGGGGTAAGGHPTASSPPGWARRMRSEQAFRAHTQATTQALREGDRGGSGLAPDLSEER
jgi:type IV secretion system protein TrbL